MSDIVMASPAARARCEAEMQKPATTWQTITLDTVNNGHDKKGPGMFYGVEFPWTEAMLHSSEWGAEWLTKAFHACGTLPADNKVKRIVTEDKIKVTTGNNGGKFLFEVEYEKPSPDLDTKLFAKIPFPNEGKTKTDRLSSSVNKQPAEYCEIQTSRLMEGFMPMKIPKLYFGDISNETSNWILITECIKYQFDEQNYGPPGEKLPPLAPFLIEGPYDKCIDAANLRGDPKDYYMALVKKGALLCGLHKSGKMPVDDDYIGKCFTSTAGLRMTDLPMNPTGISGEPKNAIEQKIKTGLKFFETAKVCFPEYVTSDAFKERFRNVLMTLNAYSAELTWWKEGAFPDIVALSHGNMNLDNAYFWRDENGDLDCGVLDWGGFGISSLGHKLWWWLYCQDYEPLKDNIESLLDCFIDTYHESGGPKLDKTLVRNMFRVTAMQQMNGLVSAVPQINRMCKADNWKTIQDRYDPRIGLNIDGKSSLRLYLHCMNSIIRMIQEWDADEALYKGFIEDYYVAEMKMEAKTPVQMGLAELKKNEDIELTYQQCYDLQDTLIKAYETPAFQRSLHRAFLSAGSDAVAQGKGRQAVCLPIQIPVLSKLGFTPDRKGVAASTKCFTKYQEDKELGAQTLRLNVLVNPPLQDNKFVEQMGISKKDKDILLNFDEAYQIQDEFIKAYSKTEFQKKLHEALDGKENDPSAATVARADVCLPFQAEVLGKFGFSLDAKGVKNSLKHFRNKELYEHERGQELTDQSSRLAWLVTPQMQDEAWYKQHGLVKKEPSQAPAGQKLVVKEMVGETEVPIEEARYAEILEEESVQPVLLTEDGEIVADPEKQPMDVHRQRGQVVAFLESENKYLLATFDGMFVQIQGEKLKGFEPPPSEEGGFDVVWPGDGDEELEWLGPLLCHTVLTKGFCVMQMRNTDDERASFQAPVERLQQWTRMPKDIEAAYLGRNMENQKVHWLPTDDMSTPTEDLEDGLKKYDRTLTDIAAAVGPLTQDFFGFSGFGRSAGLVRSLVGKKDNTQLLNLSNNALPAGEVWNQEGLSSRVQAWYGFLQYRRLCMMSFVSGSAGTMTLHPKEGSGFKEEVSFPVEPNRTVIFRHELFSYTFSPEAGDFLALQAWLLSEPHQNAVTHLSSEVGVAELSRPAPPYGNTGRTVGVMSMDTNLAGNSVGIDKYWSMLGVGCDCGTHISQNRWDHESYYHDDKYNIVGFQYYAQHCNTIGDNIFNFDNEFWGMPAAEAQVTDPMIRCAIEMGYSTLAKAGFNRKTLNGQDMATYLGSCGSDWTQQTYDAMASDESAAYVRHAIGMSFNVARIPYYLNVKGVMAQCDTACSSSLVAIYNGFSTIRPQESGAIQRRVGCEPKWTLCMGANALIGPGSWVALCGPHMVSYRGRCFTFDATADGFGRGEGWAGVTLRDNAMEEEPSDRFAMICGAACNQDGRSASMTAPHGPSQQENLWNSFREADILPADVRIAELHGTGTALGDPIEVGALRGVLRKRTLPVYKTSSKSNFSHGEATAGIAGFIKCILVTVASVCTPNVHLTELNPNMDTNAYPVIFSPEFSEAGGNSGYCGVSSFGFGGTNGRSDVWARAQLGPFQTGGSFLYDKLSFLRAKQKDLEDRARAFDDPDITDELRDKTFSSVLTEQLQKSITAPSERYVASKEEEEE